MQYKGEYSPSYLLDPVRPTSPPLFFFDGMQEEYTWHPLPECEKELDKTRYACFAHPEHSSKTPAPQRGQRRRSWRGLLPTLGLSAATPGVTPSVLQSLKIVVIENGKPRIGSFSVRPLFHP